MKEVVSPIAYRFSFSKKITEWWSWSTFSFMLVHVLEIDKRALGTSMPWLTLKRTINYQMFLIIFCVAKSGDPIFCSHMQSSFDPSLFWMSGDSILLLSSSSAHFLFAVVMIFFRLLLSPFSLWLRWSSFVFFCPRSLCGYDGLLLSFSPVSVLAHLSQRLTWAFLIKICPLSVVVVVGVGVVINFSHVHLILQNPWANFNKT